MESAEIFVVCQYYIAPDKIDPKFLDAKHVFSDLEFAKRKNNVLHPEKIKKPKPFGYPENDYTLYHKLPASEYIAKECGVEGLQDISEIVIDDERIANHEKTTNEIVECCKDIKVLGRKDIRKLIAWWRALRDEFHGKDIKEPSGDVEDEDDELTKTIPITLEDMEDMEEEEINKQIVGAREEEAKELKKKKKKVAKERQKLNERLNLKMVLKGDEGPKLEGDDMFDLKQIKTHQQLEVLTNQTPDTLAESEDDSDSEVKRPKWEMYDKESGHLDSKGLYYKDEESDSEGSGSEYDSDESGLGNYTNKIFLIFYRAKRLSPKR